VSYPDPFTPRNERERSIVELACSAAQVAAEHAARHDRDATFPIEGLAELARSGFLALTVPRPLGGQGASVAEMVLANLELAKGDGSLALVVAMHGALLGRVRDAELWPASSFERIGLDIVAARDGHGALINSLASEPEMGSPSRGGLPSTTARRAPDGWRITGRKTFSTGAPVLRWGVVSAAADGGRLASFLIPLAAPGVRVEPTWDTLGMRATGSHTVVFDDVEVADSAELPRADASAPGGSLPHERAWSLTVAAVYLGIAEAARDFAVHFARERKPSALGGKSIASVPHIRQRAGHLDLLLLTARGLLVSTAREWDARPAATVDAALAAAKVVASNTAVQVAEEAMRLVGGSSLDRSAPLERYYRDVRGGLHHPPQDDAALELFARQALD
jgi:alkylation response protein AidB-like acyl-CoA dehydrogenase